MKVLTHDIVIEKLISYVEEAQRANSTIVAANLIRALTQED